MGMNKYALNLQLFADGGASGTGAAGDGAGSATGVTGQEAAVPVYDRAMRQKGGSGVRYDAVQTTEAPAQGATTPQVAAANTEAQAPVKPTFQELIEGDYKDDFSKTMQGIVQKRLKTAKDAEDRLSRLAPALQIVAEKYGLDFTDVSTADPDALIQALEQDRSLYEEEAYREGVSVEHYMRTKQLERQVAAANAQKAQQAEEAKMREQYARLQEQADAFRQKVPAFNLAAEMQNETFARMVVTGFPVENAYYAIHYAEVEAQRQQQTQEQLRTVAQTAQQQAAIAIRSGQRRPTENGISNTPATSTKPDPRSLSLAEIREIKRRAARGETIQF